MRRLARIGAALMVVSVVAGAVGLAAYRAGFVPDEHQGVASVPAGGFFSFEFRVFGKFTEIGYEFVVEAGPSVDIYLLTPGDFARYEAGLPLAAEFPSEEHEDVRFVEGSPYPSEGTWVAVIDNSDYGAARPLGQEAVVRYDLSAGGYPGRDAFVDTLLMGASLLGLLFVFCLGLVLFITCPACGAMTRKWPCPNCGAYAAADR